MLVLGFILGNGFELKQSLALFLSSADLRTDDAHSASPDSEQIEPSEAGLLGRNSESVEQIQEKSHF